MTKHKTARAHDLDEFGHWQGGKTSWQEQPAAGYLPPVEALPVLHDFAERIKAARRICLEYFGPPQKGHKQSNWVKAILRVATGDAVPSMPSVLYFDSKLAIDSDGATRTGASGIPRLDKHHQGPTSYTDDDGDFLDANVIPYFVLPKFPGDFWWSFGIRPYDIGAIVAGEKVVFAIFGDQGPPTQLGEASIQVHRLLGKERVNHGKLKDASFADSEETELFVQTIVFPGSGSRDLTSADGVRKRGMELFRAVGGAPA
jgi:hypothetical protein